jgi:hypothetical protein
MKKCKDIKNRLPLYLDDSLPPMDKKAVEEHLKTCPQCTKILTQLSKTQTLVNNLAEVNPPPWLKQKIMAGVREKVEKKSLVEKLFYPLQIKIPVQIFATIFIAVIAVYIYRAGENQMKEVATSPAPVMEFQKEQLPGQKNKIAADEALQKKGQPVQKEDMATTQKDITPEKAAGTVQQKEQAIPKEERAIPQKDVMPERLAATDADRVKDASETIAPAAKADKYKGSSAARSIAMPQASMEKKQASDALGASMKASPAPLAQNLSAKSKILLRVADIDKAAGEVEKLLTKYGANNMVRKTSQGKVILTAQLKNQKIKDLTAQLKTIGLIETGEISADSSANETTVVIEISSQ